MLKDEQFAVLPLKAREYWKDLQQGLTSFSAVYDLTERLANALLACQRLERQLSGARIILEEMYDWLPLPADDVYRRMKATLKAEAEDAE